MVLEALLSISFSQNHCFPRCHLAMQDVKNNPTLKKTIENNQTEKKSCVSMENNVAGIFRPVRTCFVGQAHGSFQDFHDLFRPSITRHHAHLPQATNSFVFDDGLHVMETARRKTTKATTMMSAHGMQKQRPKTTKKRHNRVR